jgi:hypothetical protein
MAGDHDLAGTIKIGWGQNFALRSLFAEFLHLPAIHAKDSSHSPLSYWDSLLHKPSPKANDLDRVRKGKGTRDHQGAIFPKAMSCSEMGNDSFLCLENPQDCNARRQDSRLGVLSQFEYLFGALKAQGRNGMVKNIIRFLEDFSGLTEILKEFLSHSDILRPLARKDEGRGFHGYFFPAYSLFNSRPMTFL